MRPARTSPSSPTGTSGTAGEAVAALVGDAETIARIDDGDLPIEWQPLEPILDPAVAAAPGTTQFHDAFPGNVLTSGRVARGDVETALAASAIVATGTFQTSHLEHAYIEPEAGFARRDGDRIEVVASTQTPYMDRDEIALILGLAPDRVRVVPTACGGGFGGKLDLSLQPLIAMAAWLLDRAVRCVYTRPESMRSTTKRHPARITASLGADADGRFTALDVPRRFRYRRVRLVGPDGRQPRPGACLAGRTTCRRFGRRPGRSIRTARSAARSVVSACPRPPSRSEALVDDVAAELGIDRLEIRLRNALRAGSTTATGQVLAASAGLVPCLEALRPAWVEGTEDARHHNQVAAADRSPIRRGIGIGAMWYGIGNTSLHKSVDHPDRPAAATGRTSCSAAPRTSGRARTRS